jgi:hypothetical protein
MKILMILLSVILVLSSCKKEEVVLKNIDSLTAFWHFNIYGENGRGIAFEFSDTEMRKRKNELYFDWHITNQDIVIELISTIDNGECPKFPNTDGSCTSSGSIFIPEELLPLGDYNLILKTPRFEVQSQFIFDSVKYTLLIATNAHFSSSINEVYPIPKNILLGSIVYKGDENTTFARNFINELNSIGFPNTIVPHFDKIPISNVDSNGVPKEENWPPDNYSMGYVCSMENNFRTAYDIAEQYFNAHDISIYMFSSNGDQARLNKVDGITTVFIE